jgi:hypothetical protein
MTGAPFGSVESGDKPPSGRLIERYRLVHLLRPQHGVKREDGFGKLPMGQIAARGAGG